MAERTSCTTTTAAISSPMGKNLTIAKSNIFRHHSSSFAKCHDVLEGVIESSATPRRSSRRLNSLYTSLRDVVTPSKVGSPTTASSAIAGGHPGYEIAIRNRLVKQAAWAYLQPMYAIPVVEEAGFLRRTWNKFSAVMAKNSVVRAITKAFDWFLRAIRVLDE